MEAIAKIYQDLIDIAVRIGAPKESAFVVPGFFLLLIFGLMLRFIINLFPHSKKQKSKSATPVPSKSAYVSQTPFISGENSSDHRAILRHFDRIEMNLRSTFKTEIAPETPKSCSIHDVSLSGLSFIAEEKIQKGMRVRIFLPNLDKQSDSKEFVVSGEIVRIKPLDKKEKKMEYGIRFFHLLRRESDLLNLVMEKYK
jgi:hypothetical protein